VISGTVTIQVGPEYGQYYWIAVDDTDMTQIPIKQWIIPNSNVTVTTDVTLTEDPVLAYWL